MEFIREKREFYLDHDGLLGFYPSGSGKRAVDKINKKMLKKCVPKFSIFIIFVKLFKNLFS